MAYARKFYVHLADPVDVRGTDGADLATVQHLADGARLRLTLRAAARATARRGPPTTSGRFLAEARRTRSGSTCCGGDDRVVGDRRETRTASTCGCWAGDGNDAVDDSQGGGLDVQDPHGLDGPARPRARR